MFMLRTMLREYSFKGLTIYFTYIYGIFTKGHIEGGNGCVREKPIDARKDNRLPY